MMLVVAAAIGLGVTNAVGYAHVAPLLHARHSVLDLSFAGFVEDGLLPVFFFIAGLELRHEFTRGALSSIRQASVPIVAAAAGMVMPAVLFLLLAPASARGAWGVPMATDIPLSLALLAIAGRGLPSAFRAFILSLAIIDDTLSIIVIAVAFGRAPSATWLLVAGALVWVYARTSARSPGFSVVVAVAAWLAMLHSGVHPTVLGAVLGVVTAAQGERIRERLQPWSSWVILPLFIATSLAIPVQGSGADWQLVGAVTIARIVGKPLGILLGALLAVALLKPAARLNALGYLLVGTSAGPGFSVSMLFAELSLSGTLLQATKLAVLAALVIAAAVGAAALMLLRRRVSEVRQPGM